MYRKDIDLQAKKDFSNKINEQAGRTSSRELTLTKHMTEEQKKEKKNVPKNKKNPLKYRGKDYSG